MTTITPIFVIGPIFLIVAAATVLVALGLRYRRRELQHRERMAALDKGLAVPDLSDVDGAAGSKVHLLRGMQWLFGGIALTLFLFGNREEFQPQTYLAGLIPSAVGIAHLIFFWLGSRTKH